MLQGTMKRLPLTLYLFEESDGTLLFYVFWLTLIQYKCASQKTSFAANMTLQVWPPLVYQNLHRSALKRETDSDSDLIVRLSGCAVSPNGGTGQGLRDWDARTLEAKIETSQYSAGDSTSERPGSLLGAAQ